MSANSSISSSEVPADQAKQDRADFLRDLTVRLAPLMVLPLLHCILVLIADPYDLFHLPLNITSATVRANYAAPVNPAFFRFTKYESNPLPDIVLGDSRMDLFHPERIKQHTGQDIANLAIPGGTLETTVDAYWLAAEKTKLRSVTIGVSFDAYNDFRVGSEIATVRTIQQNPMLYFSNRNVIDASLQAYRERLGFVVSDEFQLDRMSKKMVWDKGVETYSASLRNWRNPVRYKTRLHELSEHSHANGTRLQFVILPQHDDATRLISQFGLGEEYASMRKDLAKIAPLVDLSAPTDSTGDSNQFTDMLHFSAEMGSPLIAKIWTTNH